VGDDRLHLLLGVHNHQPVGNFDGVVREATVRAYHPFLEAVRAAPGLAVTVHCSGGLLEWMREHAGATFDLLGALASGGRVELLTGAFYEPILPMLPDWDKVGQIQALTEFLRVSFGVRPRGLWLAERVWEPHFPKVLREAGVEFVLLDDAHFALAGLDPEQLGGYYLTEEQGAALAVFPINQRLRYLVPWKDPAESLRYLEDRRGAGSVTLLDDGEKFGAWPGTDRLVYGERWLARFFEALCASDWLRLATLSCYLDSAPPRGRVYLPTASYTEMGEWALPAEAWEELEGVKERLRALPDGERLTRFVRAGFWRHFLVKYPEMADAYWKMLGLSRRLHEALAARPGDPRLRAARAQLWRGQANDAYWHGVFGGCYLPHLRRAVKSSLIAADRALGEAAGPASLRCERRDGNADGRTEVSVRTAALSLTLNPDAGGTITELADLARTIDVADVLTRRREGYHRQVRERVAGLDPDGRIGPGAAPPGDDGASLSALLEYDPFRRASLLDGLFAATGRLDPLSPWAAARLTLGERGMGCEIAETADGVEIVLALHQPDSMPLGIRKSVAVPSDRAELLVRYRVDWTGSEPLMARWGVQFNLALSAGDAPGRYYRLPGQPSLGSRGAVPDQRGVAMVDEWLGCAVGLHWVQPCEVGWAPVETVSLSETGFERIYQGSALLLAWPLRLEAGGHWATEIRLSLTGAPGGV
jgi:hypothetical protein